MKAIVVALSVVSLAACKSTESRPTKPLPFHVAVIPIQDARVREVKVGGDENATEMRFAPDFGDLTQKVADALAHGTFTRVSLLTPRAPSGAVDANADPAEDWQRQARELGADLIVACELSYEPTIRRDTNGNFWLNVPLFLIGGPFCYFLKDQAYSADVELAGTFHDLRAMERTSAQLGDRQAQVVETNARFDGVDMNFIQRAHGNVGKYAVSFLIPAGFLARDSRALASELDDEVVKEISDGFAKSVQQKRDDLVRSKLVSPFYLDPDQVQLSIEGNQLHVRGPVYLLPNSEVDSMTAFRLKLGESKLEHEFGEPQSEPGGPGGRSYLRYDIDDKIDLGKGDGQLTLELVAVARHVRSYTFAVPPRAVVVAQAQ